MKRLWVVVFAFLMLYGAFFPGLAHGQALPDLTVDPGPSGLLEVINDQRDTVAVTIRNTGTDTARTSIDVAVFLSADAVPLADEKVGTDLISQALAPGDSVVVQIPVRVPALLTLGSYVWIAQVDALGSILESDEGNNIRVGNAVDVVAPPADLTIVSAPVGPSEANLNGSYGVALTIENRGDGPTQTGFDVSVFLSRDGVWDTTDVEVGKFSIVNTLSPGIQWPVQVSVNIPASVALGDYQWLARVDAGGAISEFDEANNAAVGNAVAVVNKLADLIIAVPPSGPNGVFQRGTYQVTTTIQNRGTGNNTNVFDVVVYLTEDLVVGNDDDVRVGDVAIRDVLPVDSSRVVEVPVAISALQALRAYHWVAVVDVVGFVEELDEENNALIGQAVSVVAAPPDLSFENVRAPSQVQRNGVYSVALDVVNTGDGATTGAFQVAIYLSADDSVGNGDDVRVGNGTVTQILASGRRTALELSVAVPALQAFGAYQLVAVVDAGGVETEADESNNAKVSGVVINVEPSPPDLLFVTDPSAGERVFRGVVDTVEVQIRNQGAGDVSSAFDVFIYLSSDSEISADDVQVGTLRLETPVASGETLTAAVPITIPVDQALGTYRWWARADASGDLGESDETNNERMGIAVSVVHFPADLAIYDELDAPVQVARGGVYTISVPVRNEGSGPVASGFQIEVFLSVDQRLDDADVVVGARKFPEALGAGEARTVSVSVSVPIEQPVADYRWIARVDDAGLQDDADLDNNIRLGEPISFPVLAVEPDTLNFGLVRVGATRSLTFEVRNGGTARLSFEIESPDPQITIRPQSIADLPPGVRWPITVAFAPQADGVLSAVLRLDSNDPDSKGQVLLRGVGETPQTDRIALDLDPDTDNQHKTSRHVFPHQRVPIGLYMSDLPPILTATILVEYDADRLAFVDGSWAPKGLFEGVSDIGATQVDTGKLALYVADVQNISSGSGALGAIEFETLSAFRDSTGEGAQAAVRVVQIHYLLASGEADSLQIQAASTLVYDLVCWADFDADGRVALGDFLLFKDAFEKRDSDDGWAVVLPESPLLQTPYRRYDGNGDGIVNLSDFVLLTRAFGQTCAP